MGWVGGWGLGPESRVQGMAGGRKAEELLGVVGTDESTSPLALDYVFSERPQRFACFTLSCS